MTTDDKRDEKAGGGAARAAPVILLVMAASAIVAIAATGTGLLLPAVDLTDGWLWAVRIAAGFAAAGGVAALLVQRRRLLSAADRRYDPAVAALVTAASLMGVLALMSLLAPDPAPENEENRQVVAGERAPSPEGSGSEGTGSARSSSGIPGGFGMAVAGRSGRGGAGLAGGENPDGDDRADWTRLGRLGAILILILLVALAMISLRILRRGASAEPEPLPEPPVAAADAEAGLQASLDALALDERDPRGRITAAYGALLAALADAGAPREPQEAPYEHLHRTLGPLSVDSKPMHRLAGLYVVAQFSGHAITERHTAAAAEALELALLSLRSAHPQQLGARDPQMADA